MDFLREEDKIRSQSHLDKIWTQLFQLQEAEGNTAVKDLIHGCKSAGACQAMA